MLQSSREVTISGKEAYVRNYRTNGQILLDHSHRGWDLFGGIAYTGNRRSRVQPPWVAFEIMPIDLYRIRAICFDVDGTLSDTDNQFVQNLVKILIPIRFVFFGKDLHRIARKLVMFTEGPGNWAYGLADSLGIDSKIAKLGDIFYRAGLGRSPKPFQIVSGVKEMLACLSTHYPLSIISARGHHSTYRFLLQYELLSYFKAVATGQTCRHTKPYPDPLEWAAERMGVSPEACLMVGDTAMDILCGKKASAQTVGVLCGFGQRHELERAGADLILDHTSELRDILLR